MSFSVAKKLMVPFVWETVSASNCVEWPFSKTGRIDEQLRRAVAGPRVYRFRYSDSAGRPVCYIGESEKFERRFGDYLRTFKRVLSSKPTKDSTLEELEDACKRNHTNAEVRVSAAILNANLGDALVELQFLSFDEFVMNGALIALDMLSDPFKRRAVENLAILDSESSGIRVINRGRDVTMKRLSSLLEKVKKHATQK